MGNGKKGTPADDAGVGVGGHSRFFRYTFTAEGYGVFPLRLLALDKCHPDGMKDVDQMLSTRTGSVKRMICFVGYASLLTRAGPHSMHWKDLGWDVGNVRVT